MNLASGHGLKDAHNAESYSVRKQVDGRDQCLPRHKHDEVPGSDGNKRRNKRTAMTLDRGCSQSNMTQTLPKDRELSAH